LDPKTGEIIDRRHPHSGAVVTDTVLLLPAGRGSSSASSILLEAVRMGTAPAAIVTLERDAILALGAAVARELYTTAPPVIVLESAAYGQIQTGHDVEVDEAGLLTVRPNLGEPSS
jgi:predicted aconitase with swiveling domain